MKILYGLASEGMGHALRSKPIIEHLIKNKHDVLVVCDGKVYDFMSKFFKTSKIPSFKIIHSDSKVRLFKTFFYNFFKMPVDLVRSLKFIRIMTNFKPDLVITDFEPYSSYYGKLFRKKIISINNQEIATKTDIDDFGSKFSNLTNRLVINSFIPFADKHIITTFFYPTVKSKNTFLVPPILREEIIKSKSVIKEHILVYIKNEELIPVLKKLKAPFVFYGLDREGTEKNVTFKKFSEQGFLEDLRSCKAIICGGGFTTISEALFLGKPIFSIPIKNHYEQFLNAHYISKLNYGIMSNDCNLEKIKEFIKKNKVYRKQIDEYSRKNNNEFFKRLDLVIKETII